MAQWRRIQTQFWSDPENIDMPSEMKLLYLCLLTNPRTTASGAYAIHPQELSIYTGYPIPIIESLLEQLAGCGKIRYDQETHEVLITDWFLYSPPTSATVQTLIRRELASLRNAEFRSLREHALDDFQPERSPTHTPCQSDRVSIPYGYSIDTVSDSPQSDARFSEKGAFQSEKSLTRHVSCFQANTRSLKTLSLVESLKTKDLSSLYNVSEAMNVSSLRDFSNRKISQAKAAAFFCLIGEGERAHQGDLSRAFPRAGPGTLVLGRGAPGKVTTGQRKKLLTVSTDHHARSPASIPPLLRRAKRTHKPALPTKRAAASDPALSRAKARPRGEKGICAPMSPQSGRQNPQAQDVGSVVRCLAEVPGAQEQAAADLILLARWLLRTVRPWTKERPGESVEALEFLHDEVKRWERLPFPAHRRSPQPDALVRYWKKFLIGRPPDDERCSELESRYRAWRKERVLAQQAPRPFSQDPAAVALWQALKKKGVLP